MFWRMLGQDRKDLPTEENRAHSNEDSDSERDRRVPVARSGHGDENSCNDDTHASRSISDDLEVCALHVQGFLGALSQENDRDHIDEQADGPDDEHRPGLHLDRVADPTYGFEDNS